jgi:hypothetical protein
MNDDSKRLSLGSLEREPSDNVPMGPPSNPVTYKAKTYLPNAENWAKKLNTIEEEASKERLMTTPTKVNRSYRTPRTRSYRTPRTRSYSYKPRYRSRRHSSRRHRSRRHSSRRHSSRRHSSRRHSSRKMSSSHYTVDPNGSIMNETGKTIMKRSEPRPSLERNTKWNV